MLKQHNIGLFVIPAHTSHLTQLFYVGIGSPMKSLFSDILRKLMKDFNINENNTGQLRNFCIKAAIVAWDVKANKSSCIKAAELTGLNPLNDKKLKSCPFVCELTKEIQKVVSFTSI